MSKLDILSGVVGSMIMSIIGLCLVLFTNYIYLEYVGLGLCTIAFIIASINLISGIVEYIKCQTK